VIQAKSIKEVQQRRGNPRDALLGPADRRDFVLESGLLTSAAPLFEH